ncbi:MAG: peptidylprolyl isomerase [Candidatus Vogelbacteria bacterium]|nr:peptidylprolyl isomerase [Candidatus Vogelbacteria bacterium]
MVIKIFSDKVVYESEVRAKHIMEMNDKIVDRMTNIRWESMDRVLSDVIFRTSKGEITMEFMPNQAPNTVANFLKLVKDGFYNGTKFHRVIKGFMIQGGDPITKTDNTYLYGTGGPGYTFDDEISSQKFRPGIVAMANSGPNTNGSQFFIVTGDDVTWLEGKYTIFGRVIKGMDVVRAIENVKTGEKDMPTEPVFLNEATTRY